MRARHRGCFALIVLLVVLPLCGDEWEDLRNRPGNDDIFVMIDASSSMAPSEGGSLGRVKGFLQDVLARYVKQGDRIILMTFDADAHVHGIVPIIERRRDVELLRDVIDGIDVRRPIHYSGTWPDLQETRRGPWSGGGAATDYCEMWRLSARIVQKYGELSHRQLFLLFTDGIPDGPAYRPCNDSSVVGALSSRLREGRLRMGIVALPAASSPAQELSPHLRQLLRQIPVKVLEFRSEGRRMDGARRDMLELLNARVDLLQPDALSLGARSTIDLHIPLTVINRSSLEKTIAIRNATLQLRDGAALAIPVTPSTITLPPRQSATVMLSRADLFERPGNYDGELIFQFGRGSRFDPAALAFSATQHTWLQAHGESAAWIGLALVIVLTFAVLWLTFENTRDHAPATVTGQYRGDPLARPRRKLQIGIAAPFGGGGVVQGELFVNAAAPSGLLFRAGANEWLLSWDGATFEPYSPGTAAMAPGSPEHEAWQFSMEMNQRRTPTGVPAWFRSKFRRTSRP